MILGLFFFLALVFALFYGVKGDDIYGTKEKGKVPWAHRWDTYLQRFFGVFVGWMMMWWVLDKSLDLFCHHHRPIPADFVDVTVFILALIGIFGRLPLFIHNLINLFGLGKK